MHGPVDTDTRLFLSNLARSRDVTPSSSMDESPDSDTLLQQCAQIQETELTIESPLRLVQSYYTTSQHVFLQSSLTFEHVLIMFPLSIVERSATRIALNMTILEMIAQDTSVQHGIDDSVVARMYQRSSEMSNIVRSWFALINHAPPPVTVEHPEANTVLRETVSKPHQKLLEFVLQRAGDLRLRRAGTDMFEPHCLEDGTPTQFYRFYMDTRQFVMSAVTPMSRYAEQYCALTLHPSTASFVTTFLSEIPDPRVPQLVVNRHLFSFRNGIFDARTGRLHAYRDATFTDVTAKFFDTTIDPHHLTCAPMDVPTPHFDKILTDQQLDHRTKFWMYAMCGRAFHNVGSMDDWQVCMFIRGVAGSGKSTILKVMKQMYEESNVGSLMSDGQPTFADEHLFDKFMVVAMDLDREVQISGTRMNSMISGEGLSVNRKHKIALNCEWTAPLLMASNSQPPFKDTAGNIVRRFVIFLFNHPIRYSDPQLFAKLKREVPVLVVKMARVYLEAVAEYGTRGLWELGVLPPLIHDARRQYLVTTNPLSAFLESDWVEFGNGLRTSSSDVRKFMAQYSREHGERRNTSIGQISAVDHGHLFQMYGCQIVVEKIGQTVRTYIDGMSVNVPS